MQCLCSGEQSLGNEMAPSSESPATKDYSDSVHSSRPGETEKKPDIGNIEEAETSLRESGCLNYEFSAALWRLKYLVFAPVFGVHAGDVLGT
ncbi:UNVERIFIED_CONTAM: hypothetical protein Sradi_0264300 [Sesamum radiatum]|uniref:Uncharacterized protein n=1 Tax=Sesamum radiatum TaxID=300843 RepID=A0AAW2W0Q3_SESRA